MGYETTDAELALVAKHRAAKTAYIRLVRDLFDWVPEGAYDFTAGAFYGWPMAAAPTAHARRWSAVPYSDSLCQWCGEKPRPTSIFERCTCPGANP